MWLRIDRLRIREKLRSLFTDLRMTIRSSITLILTFAVLVHASAQNFELPVALNQVIDNHCVDCHDELDPKGGLDFYSLEWNLEDPHLTERWVKVHDVVAAGEMPPPERSRLDDGERAEAVAVLADRLIKSQEAAYVRQGRSVSRRVNRFEYQNMLRDLLYDPALKVADDLPLDGEVHGFSACCRSQHESTRARIFRSRCRNAGSQAYDRDQPGPRFHSQALLSQDRGARL